MHLKVYLILTNLQLVFLDYGMKDKNPVDHVRFYNKKDPTAPIHVRKDQVGGGYFV